MAASAFVGRKKEMERPRSLFSKRSASLVVVKGRRRIGKSRLIEEFAKGKRFFVFSGILPSEGTTQQSQ